MKVKKPTAPSAANYLPHRCPWGYRNPKNHLTAKQFAALIIAMLKSDDMQHVTCPGCKRSIYLSLRINSHNRAGQHAPEGILRNRWDIERQEDMANL